MATEFLTEDAKAILLLCGSFRSKDPSDCAPLNLTEYNSVSEWLKQRGWRPAALLSEEGTHELINSNLLASDRVSALLSRGASLALSLEKWMNKGLWVSCRSDPTYPVRFKIHLKRQAPPILYGAGDPERLNDGGMAIVGSRNVDEEGAEFTAMIGRRAGEHGISIISGGARGVDQIAMQSALEVGGRSVGVMSDGLLRAALSGKYRDYLRNGNVALISPYNPEAGFNVGMAMGRNKLIYALADQALVVSAETNKGGTWSGAEEELRRPEGRPVYVRIESGVPEGNQELIKLGAREFPLSSWLTLFKAEASLEPRIVYEGEMPASTLGSARVQQSDMEIGSAAIFKPGLSTDGEAAATREITANPAPEESPVDTGYSIQPAVSIDQVYQAIRPILLEAVETPKTSGQLATELHVRKNQLEDWLLLALQEGVIVKMSRPAKYVLKGACQQGKLKLE